MHEQLMLECVNYAIATVAAESVGIEFCPEGVAEVLATVV